MIALRDLDYKLNQANKQRPPIFLNLSQLLMNFSKYLSTLREQLKSGQCTNFVMGNSGADYDSVIGAITYAFHLTNTQGILYLPLIDCPEKELPLRFQIMKVLTDMKIDHHQFLYTEMVPDLWTNNYRFVLNDHNKRPQLTAEKLHEIIDHHAYDKDKIKCPHVINHCGSANTLIYYVYYPELIEKFEKEQYIELKELYAKLKAFLDYRKKYKKYEPVDDQDTIDQLLYYGIMIDTYGVNQNMAHMYNDFDEYAVQTLQNKIKPHIAYEDIGWAKYNVQDSLKLTFMQQVQKDYKYLQYDGFFIHYSTVPLDNNQFKKAYWQQLLKTYPIQKMKPNEARVFMFSFPREKEDILKAKFRKIILVASNDPKTKQKIVSVMNKMGFQKIGERDGWQEWIDNSGRISRKILDAEIRNNSKEAQFKQVHPKPQHNEHTKQKHSH